MSKILAALWVVSSAAIILRSSRLPILNQYIANTPSFFDFYYTHKSLSQNTFIEKILLDRTMLTQYTINVIIPDTSKPDVSERKQTSADAT
jgi:hypothetical protein